MVTGRMMKKMHIIPNQSGTIDVPGTSSCFMVIICVRLQFLPSFRLSDCSFLPEFMSFRSILTGIRCCILIKFPAELSVGTSEYLEPVASEIAVTVP